MARILVVEDDAVTRMLIRLCLESADHIVVDLADGSRALDELDRELPDLVISDVEMPDMDGFQLLREMRSRNRLADVPVLFLTGHEDQQTFRRGALLGAHGLITKPIDRCALLRMVSNITRTLRQADATERSPR